MIQPNDDGLIMCPNCSKWFKPVLTRNGDEPIQRTHPNSKPFEREQLISGLCCNKCWNEYLGLPTRKSVVIKKKQQEHNKVYKAHSHNKFNNDNENDGNTK